MPFGARRRQGNLQAKSPHHVGVGTVARGTALLVVCVGFHGSVRTAAALVQSGKKIHVRLFFAFFFFLQFMHKKMWEFKNWKVKKPRGQTQGSKKRASTHIIFHENKNGAARSVALILF